MLNMHNDLTYAPVVELEDTSGLSPDATACRFDSCRGHKYGVRGFESHRQPSGWRNGRSGWYPYISPRSLIGKTEGYDPSDAGSTPAGETKNSLLLSIASRSLKTPSKS